MQWRRENDFPKETGEQLCEVIQRPNDPGSMGGTSIYPTYVRFVKGDNCWLNPPEGYKVQRWLDDETPTTPTGWPGEGIVYTETFMRGFLYVMERLTNIDMTRYLDEYSKTRKIAGLKSHTAPPSEQTDEEFPKKWLQSLDEKAQKIMDKLAAPKAEDYKKLFLQSEERATRLEAKLVDMRIANDQPKAEEPHRSDVELTDDLWDKHSESLPEDIHGLADVAGDVIMREQDFRKAITEYFQFKQSPSIKRPTEEQFDRDDMEGFADFIVKGKWTKPFPGIWESGEINYYQYTIEELIEKYFSSLR